MEINALKENARVLEQEIGWFERVTDTALKLYFGNDCPYKSIYEVLPPAPGKGTTPYATLLRKLELGFEERYVLILALIPHLRPQVLDVFFSKNEAYDRGFTEFGGIRGTNHGGFIPTGETAVFLLSGNDMEKAIALQHLFSPDHVFSRNGILKLGHVKDEPAASGALLVTEEYLTYLIHGTNYTPGFGSEFPAKRIETPLKWADLVLEEQVMNEVMEVRAWIEHHGELMDEWGLNKVIKPGFKCLFYGPPGTGKTLTASLLGKVTGYDVFRVDLSLVVSKYIGETEKNLANVFNQAEHRNWILFFDEADALFGKRTQTRGSNDRYANQEVAYLLQRIEDFPGVVVLATNLESNIDEAFMRRFHSMIHFPLPNAGQRLTLWKQMFGKHLEKKHLPVLKELADKYELSGGSLVNVLRYGAIQAVARGEKHIHPDDIRYGIRREYQKQGKMMV